MDEYIKLEIKYKKALLKLIEKTALISKKVDN